MREVQAHFETLLFLVRDANHSQSAPDSLEMYPRQVGRSGRDGQIAVCLLSSNPSDLGPLRRAATRAAVFFADVKAAAGVVLPDLGTSSSAIMEGKDLKGGGIQVQRVDEVLRVLGMASYMAFEQAGHAHCSMRRGPNWLCLPATLSGNAANFLYALLRPLCTPGSAIARCAVADIASSDHFAQLGMGAPCASVRAADDLATRLLSCSLLSGVALYLRLHDCVRSLHRVSSCPRLCQQTRRGSSRRLSRRRQQRSFWETHLVCLLDILFCLVGTTRAIWSGCNVCAMCAIRRGRHWTDNRA